MNRMIWIVLCLILTLSVSSIAIAQTCRTDVPVNTPTDRFVVNGTEVTDTLTGLIWTHCPLGLSGNDCSTGYAESYSTWSDALSAAESARNYTGQAWRLPNIKELRSIVEGACYMPAINLAVFPNTPSSVFWTSSPNVSFPENVRKVSFSDGGTAIFSIANIMINDYKIRLVRDPD